MLYTLDDLERDMHLLRLSAVDAARLAGISHQAIHTWRTGKYRPSSGSLAKLRRALAKDAGQLRVAIARVKATEGPQ